MFDFGRPPPEPEVRNLRVRSLCLFSPPRHLKGIPLSRSPTRTRGLFGPALGPLNLTLRTYSSFPATTSAPRRLRTSLGLSPTSLFARHLVLLPTRSFHSAASDTRLFASASRRADTRCNLNSDGTSTATIVQM